MLPRVLASLRASRRTASATSIRIRVRSRSSREVLLRVTASKDAASVVTDFSGVLYWENSADFTWSRIAWSLCPDAWTLGVLAPGLGASALAVTQCLRSAAMTWTEVDESMAPCRHESTSRWRARIGLRWLEYVIGKAGCRAGANFATTRLWKKSLRKQARRFVESTELCFEMIFASAGLPRKIPMSVSPVLRCGVRRVVKEYSWRPLRCVTWRKASTRFVCHS